MADFEKNIKKALAGMKPTDMTKMKPIDPKIQKIFEKIMGPSSKAKKMEMGGEVMDMTKSQPVNMMDGGKIKKMNMGGVVPGRGGKFKGMK